jgi:RNA polymerase sigma-70 factor (ECF subfamily)
MADQKDICNEAQFDKVYTSLVASLRNFIFFKCGNVDKAQDITQEAFIKLWQNCATVTPEKAKSYVYTVANNLFLNEVAHQKVVFKYRKEVKRSLDHQNPHFLLEEKEYGEKLQHALSLLTEVQRTAFLMSRVEGKKYREIAAILGISEKAAGKRISDALETLRLHIEKI